MMRYQHWWLSMGFVAKVVLAFLLAVVPVPVHAFDPGTHAQIVHEALDDTLNPQYLQWIANANLMSDMNQSDSWRHFDDANSPKVLCTEWTQGVGTLLTQAVEYSAPTGDAADRLPDDRRLIALTAFGEATHAIEDFYSHTNWVDLAKKEGKIPGRAPITGSACDGDAMPLDLKSGYFSLKNGPDGCPGYGTAKHPWTPPNDYKYCHAELNKDKNDTKHSPDASNKLSDGRTFREAAIQLAVVSTRDLWYALHQRILARYTRQQFLDGECVFHKLAWGGDESCLDLTGIWSFTASSVGHSDEPLNLSQIKHTSLEGTWIAEQCAPGDAIPGWAIHATVHGTDLTGNIQVCKNPATPEVCANKIPSPVTAPISDGTIKHVKDGYTIEGQVPGVTNQFEIRDLGGVQLCRVIPGASLMVSFTLTRTST